MIEYNTGGSVPAAFLSYPAADDRDLATVRRKVQLLAARQLLSADPGRIPAAMNAALGRIRPLLTGLMRAFPDAVLASIGQVDVLNHLLMWHSGEESAEESLRSAMPALLASMCVSLGKRFGETIVWDAPIAFVATPDRTYRFPAPARAIAAGPDGFEIELSSGARASDRDLESCSVATVAVAPSVRFSLFDSNPLWQLEAHPEKEGNAIDLGGHDLRVWIDALGQAFDMIRRALPEWYAELPHSLQRIVPVGFDAERHLSASYREAPGLAYLTLHPDSLTIAEAIVHETQHTKLNLLTWLDPVLENGHTCWTESPVRPDLRPLMGVLLAAHAFVPVGVLHYRLASMGDAAAKTPRFARRRAEVLSSNAAALKVVEEKGKMTAAGARLVGDLRRLQSFLESGLGVDRRSDLPDDVAHARFV